MSGGKGFASAKGVPGPKGDKGDTGAKGETGSQGPQGLPGAQGPAGVQGVKGDTGPSGSTFIGNVIVTETLLVSLALGTKRMTRPLSGVGASDKLLAVPNGVPTAGCEVLNAYPAGANQVSVGYYTPALGIAATYTIPVSIYRMN